MFAALHTDHGVDLRPGARIEAITTNVGMATGVRLAGGTVIEADAVVIGVGVTPDPTLAEQAGLKTGNGVLTDASLRSSDPDIYAVGDIANHDHPVLGHRIRVEHWATALHQPATASAALLGKHAAYTALPYFFTDQYDLGMEYAGHAPKDSYDQVTTLPFRSRGRSPRRGIAARERTGREQRFPVPVTRWPATRRAHPRSTRSRPAGRRGYELASPPARRRATEAECHGPSSLLPPAQPLQIASSARAAA